MGGNKVGDTAPGAGGSHQVERGSNKELIEDQLIASLQEYDFVGGASEADRENRDTEIKKYYTILSDKCNLLNTCLETIKKPFIAKEGVDANIKMKIFLEVAPQLTQSVSAINMYITLIQNNGSYNGQKISFADKQFDVVRETLLNVKRFDLMYAHPPHEDTFLSRGVSYQNLILLNIIKDLNNLDKNHKRKIISGNRIKLNLSLMNLLNLDLLDLDESIDNAKNAKKADRENRDIAKKDIYKELFFKPYILKALLSTIKSPTTEENNIHNKKKFFFKITETLGSIDDSLTQLENFIDNNWLSDDDRAKYDTNNDGNIDTIKKNFFADKRFDPLRNALYEMKEFDEIYDPNHQNTFLSRGINLRNLAFMGIKLTSKTENTKAGEIGDTLREGTQ